MSWIHQAILGNMENQLDENFVTSRTKINVWRLEKLRIWHNLILGGILLLPLFVEIMNRTPDNHFRRILGKFADKGLGSFLTLMLVYNLVFSIIYLFEKSEISRNNRLMSKEKIGIVFGVIFALCLLHVIFLFRG